MLDIPLHQMGFVSDLELTISDLWTEEISKLNVTDLPIKVTAPKDSSPDGDVRVLMIKTSNG